MRLVRSLVVTAAAGVIGVGAYAALPAGAAGSPSVLPAGPATLLAAAAPPPAAGPSASCETGEWPDQATGRPAGLKAGGVQGFYLWHDAGGWHLEVSHPGADHVVFSGWIATNGTFAAQRVDDERNDAVKVGPRDHTMSFVLNNYGHIDGAHFETHCADGLDVHLFVNGRPATVEEVFVGHGSSHPLSNPFTIERSGGH